MQSLLEHSSSFASSLDIVVNGRQYSYKNIPVNAEETMTRFFLEEFYSRRYIMIIYVHKYIALPTTHILAIKSSLKRHGYLQLYYSSIVDIFFFNVGKFSLSKL